MDRNLRISVEKNNDDALYVRKKLIEYNSSNVSASLNDSSSESIHLFLKDDDENILGGITGFIHWNCLHIDVFWIDDKLRGMGKGKQLLNHAEKIALEKGCRLIKLDTFSFQAPEFYKGQGYEVYGVLEDYPEGSNHYYLSKKLL